MIRREKYSKNDQPLRICIICNKRFYDKTKDTEHNHIGNIDSLIGTNNMIQYSNTSKFLDHLDRLQKEFNDPFDNNCFLGACGNIFMFYDPPWIAPDGSYIPQEQWELNNIELNNIVLKERLFKNS
jgi:hypothetical protein